jgi:hypothetical protein
LLQEHNLLRIERFLALYPLAQRLGRAEGPGWLVKAIVDPSWDPDTEQADLESRLTRQQESPELSPAPEAAEQPQLPKRITRQLQEIGWVGDAQEVLDAWQTNKRRVGAWLKWVVGQPQDHRAARFRMGLRSQVWPPAQQKDNPRRYIEGEFSEFVEH